MGNIFDLSFQICTKVLQDARQPGIAKLHVFHKQSSEDKVRLALMTFKLPYRDRDLLRLLAQEGGVALVTRDGSGTDYDSEL